MTAITRRGAMLSAGAAAAMVGVPTVVEAHAGLPPTQAVAETHLLQHLQVRVIIDTNKVVVTLQPQATKIKGGTHPADPITCLVKVHNVALLAQGMCHGQAHGTRTDYSYRLHGSLKTSADMN